MKLVYGVAALILVGFSGKPANSEEYIVSGNAMYDACLMATDSEAKTILGFYVFGALDAFSRAGEKLDLGKQYCLPDEITPVQISDSVCKWLERMPQFRASNAAWLSNVAVSHYYPCPE